MRTLRPSFTTFLDLRKSAPALCVEVGVSRGDNAFDMLTQSSYNFVLVDSYDVNNSTFQFACDGQSVGIPFTQEQREKFIQDVKGRLEQFGDRAKLYIEDSVKASERFENNSIDYIYIDAEHDTKSVLRDIQAWWPKIKKGGILGGHDLNNGAGVFFAVETMFGSEYDSLDIDWWKVKK